MLINLQARVEVVEEIAVHAVLVPAEDKTDVVLFVSGEVMADKSIDLLKHHRSDQGLNKSKKVAFLVLYWRPEGDALGYLHYLQSFCCHCFGCTTGLPKIICPRLCDPADE